MSHHTQDTACPLCEEKLETAHPDLAAWYRTSVKPAHPDAHISWAWRGEQDQERAFEDGKTQLRWPRSPHNHMADGKPCSYALDLFEIDDTYQALFRPKFYVQINDENEIAQLPIQWGGKWKRLGDGDHFQLLLPAS